MLPPLPRCSNWVSSSLISPSCISLPRCHCRVGLHIVLFEVCSAFTHVAACTLAQSPYIVTAIRGLQTFRHLHACPGCFRRERSPGGPCTHWKSAALSRRTWITVLHRGQPAPRSRRQRTEDPYLAYRRITPRLHKTAVARIASEDGSGTGSNALKPDSVI